MGLTKISVYLVIISYHNTPDKDNKFVGWVREEYL